MNAAQLQWRGDNLGMGCDSVTVHVVDEGARRDISLEEALRRIDAFDEHSRDRILKKLPYQFDIAMVEVAV